MIFLMLAFALSFNKTWCEPPLLPYEPVLDADLIQVQIITRHGARTPLHLTPAIQHVWQCNNTEFRLFNDANSHPLRVHVAHGDSIFMGDCHYGQLIGRGVTALQKLGSHIRHIYIEQMKLIPNKLKESSIKFRSTLTHRTIHSTMAFVNGLYPDSPNVVIEVADKYIDPWRRSSQICPRLKRIIEKIRKSEEWDDRFKDKIELLSKAAKVIGCKTKSAPDIIMAARCDGQRLPIEATEEILDAAALLKAQQQKFVFAHQEVFPLMFSFAATEIVNELIERANGNSTKRFIHWSAHDGNMFGFLGYLGEGSDLLPPYGSYIIIELWKSKIKANLLLRFMFNGNVLRLRRFGNQTHVALQVFIEYVLNKMPDMEKDCGFNKDAFQKKSTFMTLE